MSEKDREQRKKTIAHLNKDIAEAKRGIKKDKALLKMLRKKCKAKRR
jgi:uncharacterized coiled-coil protein SlyX